MFMFTLIGILSLLTEFRFLSFGLNLDFELFFESEAYSIRGEISADVMPWGVAETKSRVSRDSRWFSIRGSSLILLGGFWIMVA